MGVSRLADSALSLFSSGGVSTAGQTGKLHEGRGFVKAPEFLHLDHQGDRRQGVDPLETPQIGHGGPVGRVLGQRFDLGGQILQPFARFFDRPVGGIEGLLESFELELLGLEPGPVLRSPEHGVVGVNPPLTQKKLGQPVPVPGLVGQGVFSRPDQIPGGLFRSFGDPDRSQRVRSTRRGMATFWAGSIQYTSSSPGNIAGVGISPPWSRMAPITPGHRRKSSNKKRASPAFPFLRNSDGPRVFHFFIPLI